MKKKNLPTEMNDADFEAYINSLTKEEEKPKKTVKKKAAKSKIYAHLKGKTFDISYRAFSKNRKQLKKFIQALDTLHNMKKCYVKFERNGCLHITAN